MDASFEDFERALRDPDERERIGVNLADEQVRDLLADEASGQQLYRDWLRAQAFGVSRAPSRVRRTWPWLALAGCLVVIAVVGAGYGWVQLQHASQTDQSTRRVLQEINQ